MEISEIIAGIQNNPEDLKENLNLTTERCIYASKEVLTVLTSVWNISNKKSSSARECI